MSAFERFLHLRGTTTRAAAINPDGELIVRSPAEMRALLDVPSLSGNNAWTGSNTFINPLDFSTKLNSDTRWSFLFRVGGFGWANNGSGAPVGEVWVGDRSNPFSTNTPSVQLTGSRGYLNTGIPSNSGGEPNAGAAQVEWGANELHLNKLRRLSFSSTDLHLVNGADVTMTKARAIITDPNTRRVNLPPASDHSIAVVMVKTQPATKHRIYPQSGAVIYWHDFGGVSRATDSSGVETLRLPTGMFWFLSDGTDWCLQGAASNT